MIKNSTLDSILKSPMPFIILMELMMRHVKILSFGHFL
jgi:hypothetical protein